jgi:hypothetical protein
MVFRHFAPLSWSTCKFAAAVAAAIQSWSYKLVGKISTMGNKDTKEGDDQQCGSAQLLPPVLQPM